MARVGAEVTRKEKKSRRSSKQSRAWLRHSNSEALQPPRADVAHRPYHPPRPRAHRTRHRLWAFFTVASDTKSSSCISTLLLFLVVRSLCFTPVRLRHFFSGHTSSHIAGISLVPLAHQCPLRRRSGLLSRLLPANALSLQRRRRLGSYGDAAEHRMGSTATMNSSVKPGQTQTRIKMIPPLSTHLKTRRLSLLQKMAPLRLLLTSPR